MNLVLFGVPGAGKGFHAKLISDKLKIPTISTGELIRNRIEIGDDKSVILEKYVSVGGLVPDELIGEILKNRVIQSDCSRGFILDGYPRSLSQAELLDDLKINVDKAIEIIVSDEKIFERLLNRRVCKKCGATFNLVFKKPKIENCCDYCKGELVKRKDDNLDTIKKRLKVFNEQTRPLREFYKEVDKYYEVDGQAGSDNVQKKIFEIIGEDL